MPKFPRFNLSIIHAKFITTSAENNFFLSNNENASLQSNFGRGYHEESETAGPSYPV